MGLFGGDSSSNTTNVTNVADKRIALQSGNAVTADNSTIHVTNQNLDKEIAVKAFDTVTAGMASATTTLATGNALQNDGFVKMLGLADKLFATADSTIKSTQQTTLAQVGALSSAQNDAKGAIDQKTIVILAAAAVAALALFTRKK